MKRKIQIVTLAASMAAALIPSIGRADTSNLNDQLRDAQTQQERLRVETVKVGAQLDSIIAEFKRNGIQGGPDVATLVAMRSVLNHLSEQEMNRIIHLLQDARGQDSSHALHNAADAHADQANIITQLAALLHEYQQQQAIHDLADKFSQLAEQENTNLGYAVQTVKANAGRPLSAGDPAVRDAIQVQGSTQSTIETDVVTSLADLSALLNSASPEDADRIKKAQTLATDGKLADQVAAATLSIRGGTLMKAAEEEKNTRDVLRNVSHMLIMPLDTLGKLKEAAKEIDQQIALEKQATDATKAATLWQQPEAADAEQKQANVVDQTDVTRKDLDNIAPAAADDLKKAEEKMQEARAAINAHAKEPAALDQKAAMAQLDQAKQAVADQIAKAEAEAKTDDTKDNLAKLEDVKKETAQLKKDQDDLKKQTPAAQKPADQQADAKAQAKLEQKAQDLQQRAADASPKAAEKLADASAQMDKAQQKLDPKNPDTAKAADAQQAASDNIAKAQEALDKDIAQLAQDKQDEKKIEEAEDKLRQIIQDQVKENLDTGTTAAKPNDAKSAKPAALAGTQNKIGGDTATFKQSLPDSASDAVAPLTDAKTKMDGAGSALTKAATDSAVPLQKDALADLFKALQTLDKKADDLQQALGEKKDDAQKQDAELAKQLDQMQQQLAQAASKLDQPAQTPQDQQAQNQQPQNPQAQAQQQQQQQQQQAMAAMTKQQQDIAQGLKQMQQQNPPAKAQDQLAQAQQKADQAAQDLAKGDLPQANQDMQKAEQAMEKADAQEQAKPDAGQPDAGKPDAGKPDAGKPDAGKPDAGKPDAGQPDAGKPDAGKPDAGKPDAGQGKPDAGQGKPDAGQGAATLPQLQQAQQKLQQALAQQMGQQDPAAALDNMAQQMGDIAAGDQAAQAPADVQQAMQNAQQAMADAAQQAQAGNDPAAQADAAKAQSALAQAQAGMAMAQSGMPEGGPKPPGGKPGQEPGNEPGQEPGQDQQAKGNEDNPQKGTGDNVTAGKGVTDTGHLNKGGGPAQFAGLPPRDRAALQQSQAEKYPQAYGPQVEQYLQNLSNDDEK